MKFRNAILLPLLACAQPPPASIPPVTSAHPTDAPLSAEAKSTPARHPVRAKLETIDSDVFLLHRGEKGSSCERATVKADKEGRPLLEIDASSPIGCWSGKATVVLSIEGDYVEVKATRISKAHGAMETRCVMPKVKDLLPRNVKTVSDSELEIEGQRIFIDEASCKAAAPSDSSPPPDGCLSRSISFAVSARTPPPTGAFIDRFEKLIKGGGTAWVPSETQKNVCVSNQVTSKSQKQKDKDVLQVTLTSRSVEKGTRWVDTTDYTYDPTCKRISLASMSGEGTNPDGSTVGRASSVASHESDLFEQEDAKDALPISGPVFYSQNACIAWMRAQGTASSK